LQQPPQPGKKGGKYNKYLKYNNRDFHVQENKLRILKKNIN